MEAPVGSREKTTRFKNCGWLGRRLVASDFRHGWHGRQRESRREKERERAGERERESRRESRRERGREQEREREKERKSDSVASAGELAFCACVRSSPILRMPATTSPAGHFGTLTSRSVAVLATLFFEVMMYLVSEQTQRPLSGSDTSFVLQKVFVLFVNTLANDLNMILASVRAFGATTLTRPS